MTYTQFDPTTPDAVTQSIVNIGISTRENLQAMFDKMMIYGVAEPGWTRTTVGGTADQPASIRITKGLTVLRASLVWGTSGGEADNVVSSIQQISIDGGNNWDTISTETISYDVDGNPISSVVL